MLKKEAHSSLLSGETNPNANSKKITDVKDGCVNIKVTMDT